MDDEAAVDDNGDDKDGHLQHVYCKECKIWLNSDKQFEGHCKGKIHKKQVEANRRGYTGGTTDEKDWKPKPDETPDRPSAMWHWLEAAKVEKEMTLLQKGGRRRRRARWERKKMEREDVDVTLPAVWRQLARMRFVVRIA